MSLNLREELESLTDSLTIPDGLAIAATAAGRKRLVARRRRAAIVAVAAVVMLGTGVGLWPTLVDSDTAPPAAGSPTAEQTVAGVSLPDPAPGFPFRLRPDSRPRQIVVDGVPVWTRSFSVATRPEATAPDGSGFAQGPEAAIEVGTFPLPVNSGQANGHPITDRVVIAGTVGYVTTFEENGGSTVTALYFRAGSVSVAIVGLNDAATEQLVGLGSSLAGLPATKATDLLGVKATNGRLGYINRAVLDELTGANVANPVEALAWMRELEGYRKPVIEIPVYEADGVTQIGVFPVSRTGGATPSPSS